MAGFCLYELSVLCIDITCDISSAAQGQQKERPQLASHLPWTAALGCGCGSRHVHQARMLAAHPSNQAAHLQAAPAVAADGHLMLPLPLNLLSYFTLDCANTFTCDTRNRNGKMESVLGATDHDQADSVWHSTPAVMCLGTAAAAL